MKNTIVIVIVIGLMMLVACTSHVHDEKPKKPLAPMEIKMATEGMFSYNKARIYTLDGCEYIYYKASSDRAGLTHKGNCPNPIHCYN